MAETLATTLVLTQVVKHLVRRPRPFTFVMSAADSPEVEFDATLSFYSGHTAMAFASAVAALQTLHRRGHRGAGGGGRSFFSLSSLITPTVLIFLRSLNSPRVFLLFFK